jgi:hypothetical protein
MFGTVYLIFLFAKVPPLMQPLVLSTRRCMELAMLSVSKSQPAKVSEAAALDQHAEPSDTRRLHLRHFDENIGPLSPLV